MPSEAMASLSCEPGGLVEALENELRAARRNFSHGAWLLASPISKSDFPHLLPLIRYSACGW